MEESDDDQDSNSNEEMAVETTVQTTDDDVICQNSPPPPQPTGLLQKNGVIDHDDPLLEMIDLTDDLEERKDAKRGKKVTEKNKSN